MNSNSNFSEDKFSDVEDEIYEDSNKIPISLKSSNKEKDFEIGNGNFHFLPAKINHTGHCQVNVYFDSLIEKKQNKYSSMYMIPDEADNINSNTEQNLNANQNQDDELSNYSTSFRGRIFNGKKVNLENKFSFSHLKVSKQGLSSLVVKTKNEIKDYYIWKFDEEVEYNNNLLNMNQILTNLDVLK